MLETIVILLVLVWFVGGVTAYTFGGLINLLIVVAVIVLCIRIIRGERL